MRRPVQKRVEWLGPGCEGGIKKKEKDSLLREKFTSWEGRNFHSATLGPSLAGVGRVCSNTRRDLYHGQADSGSGGRRIGRMGGPGIEPGMYCKNVHTAGKSVRPSIEECGGFRIRKKGAVVFSWGGRAAVASCGREQNEESRAKRR